MSMPPPPPPSTFQPTTPAEAPYPARLEIDYPERSSRLTTAFRIILIIPIAIILGILTSGGASFWSNSDTYGNESDAFDSGAAYTFESDSTDWVASTGGGIVGALFLVTLRSDRRLVRHPLDRPVPAPAVRLRRRCRSMVAPGVGLLDPADHRSVPAVRTGLTSP